jgi:hypothetical protein
MESSKLVTDDNEHAKRFSWVFNFWQEIGRKTEGECNLGWLVEIGFENVLVED